MRFLVALGAGLLVAAVLVRGIAAQGAEQGPVTAIDILLEPDPTMLSQAQANNARLLQIYPNGFALDDMHRPHVTLIQRFVRTKNLEKVFTAAGHVIDGADVRGMRLEALKYYYTPGGDVGVAGIFVRPTPQLLKLQQELIAAVSPFTVETGPIGAFTASHDDAATDAQLIGYVATFVPKQTGEHYKPHVSTGVAPKAYLDKMVAEPFKPFTFSPVGVAIYQLGPFGTAAKRLKVWSMTR